MDASPKTQYDTDFVILSVVKNPRFEFTNVRNDKRRGKTCYFCVAYRAKLTQLAFALQILARTAKTQFFFLNLLATSKQRAQILLKTHSQRQLIKQIHKALR